MKQKYIFNWEKQNGRNRGKKTTAKKKDIS